MKILFLNTGNVSFILYGILILIIVVALLVAFNLIQKGYDSNKLDKMIDLFKYSIVTVAISTVTLIISDLYKEREQQLKELEYFDKYAEDVTRADGIQSRYDLTRYLAIVAPEGEFKKSWKRYYDTLAIEYRSYLNLKLEKQLLDSIKNPTKNQLLEKEQLIEKIRRKDIPLVKKASNYKQDPSEKNNRLYDIDGKQFGVGDFIETRFIVDGHISDNPKDNINLVTKFDPENDFILAIGRTNGSSGISTRMAENIKNKTVGYKKLNPVILKSNFPDVYEAIKKRAAMEGFFLKP